MSSQEKKIEYLKNLCNKWGWDLLEVSEEEFKIVCDNIEFKSAPFDHWIGINFNTRQILYTSQSSWTSIIHEMGHVFTIKDNRLIGVNELSFFGWEYQLAKEVDGVEAWMGSNYRYHIGNKSFVEKYVKDISMYNYTQFDFGDLIYEDKLELLNNLVECAKQQGLIIDDRVQNIRIE